MNAELSKINRESKFVLIFGFLVFSMLVLSGCGGSGSIPVASVLSSGKVTLSWNDLPGAASYELYISTTPGVTTLNSYKIPNVTQPITITDLEPGTTYYFVVAFSSNTGESRMSKEVAYTVTETEGAVEFGDISANSKSAAQAQTALKTPVSAAGNEIPAGPKSQPQAAAAPAKKTSQTVRRKAAAPPIKKAALPAQSGIPKTRDVTLAWDDVPNATSYNIYWRDREGVTKRNGTKIANVTNPYKMKNLVNGKKYYFIVTAVNATGESPASEEFSFTVGE